jgi:hypothetical protein
MSQWPTRKSGIAASTPNPGGQVHQQVAGVDATPPRQRTREGGASGARVLPRLPGVRHNPAPTGLTLRFSLEPGDCIVFDNTRILHSRTGFTATGRRHLQGCYAEIDGAESTAAILARRHAGVHDAGVHDVAAPDAARPEAANIDG